MKNLLLTLCVIFVCACGDSIPDEQAAYIITKSIIKKNYGKKGIIVECPDYDFKLNSINDSSFVFISHIKINTMHLNDLIIQRELNGMVENGVMLIIGKY